MKKTMLALVLLFGCGTLFAETHFSIGIGIGGYGPVYAPAPPPPPIVEQPPCPGEGYEWVDGYWYPVGPRFHWHAGYWRAPAYFGSPRGRVYAPAYGWRGGGGYDRGRYGHNEFRREEHREARSGYRDDGRYRR